MSPLQDDNRPHLAIIGGGVAGCTLAYSLAKRRARVTLLEAGQLGQQGASAVPVALLNPHRGRTARASDLDRDGLEATWELVEELEQDGLETGVYRSGVLRIASNERQAKKWRKLKALKWLEPGEVPTPYHAPFGAFLVERGGWLEPAKFLAALRAGAERQGVVFRETCQVETLHRTADGFDLETAQGHYKADKVILCVGATLNPSLGVPDLERFEGDVIGLRSEVALPHPLAGAVYGAQKRELTYIGGNHRPADESDPAAATRLRKSASWFVKGLTEARFATRWTGVRAQRPGRNPMSEELEPGLWFHGALGGRGFLCSALLSARLAERLAP